MDRKVNIFLHLYEADEHKTNPSNFSISIGLSVGKIDKHYLMCLIVIERVLGIQVGEMKELPQKKYRLARKFIAATISFVICGSRRK